MKKRIAKKTAHRFLEDKTYLPFGTVENCTAICAADCGDESKRQDALLVSSERDGEKFQDVVFGYDMPETVEAFLDMCDDYAAWETDAAVIASVRITEVRP